MRKYKKVSTLIITLIFMCSIIGCQGTVNKSGEKKSVKILIDSSNTDDIDAINLLIDNYKKSHNDIKIETENVDKIDKIESLVEAKKDYDILICNRNIMLDLVNKALISNISNSVNENKCSEKFYNIALSYGRKGDKYYGIGIVPYSIELIYNKKYIRQLLQNKDVMGLEDIGKVVREKHIKIPVVLPKGIDLNLALSSLIGNNIIDNNELEKNYDASKDKYLSIDKMQELFTYINYLYKNYAITKDSFLIGDNSVITKVEKGEYPLAAVPSSMLKDIEKSENIEIFNGSTKTSVQINPLIIINHVVCLLENSPNKSESNKFIDYLCKDDTYEALSKEGIITTNKKSNTNIKVTSNKILATLVSSNENSIPYYLNLPLRFRMQLIDEVGKVLKGGYDGHEWQRILNKSY